MRFPRLMLLAVAVAALLAYLALSSRARASRPRDAVEHGAAPSVPLELAPVTTGEAPSRVEAQPTPPATERDALAAPEPSAPAAEVWIVRGVVTGPDEAVLPGARVWTWSAETVADEQGAFELRQTRAGRRNSLFASAPGLAEREESYTFPEGAREVRVDLRLGPAFQVQGRVVDERGMGVAGATVTSFYTRKSSTTSAADGSFLLDHLDPGRDEHHVFARKEGYVQGSARVRTQGLLVEGVELLLARGTSVRGVVLGPDGAPLEGVALYIGFSPHANDRLDATSDAQGAFLFPNVGSGSRTLVAQHAGFSAEKQELEVPAQPPELAPLVLRLAPAHWIGGVVQDAAGTPLAKISVAALHEGEYLELDAPDTDEEGRFRIEGLPEAGVSLQFYATGFVRAELAVERLDYDELRVTLARAALVGGTVLDAATRAPLERFSVHFFEPELAPGELEVTSYDARWVREGRAFASPLGTWTSQGEELEAGAVIGVEVRAEGYAPARNAHVVAALDFDPATVVFELERGGSVLGRVFDADGAPVAGAKIFRSAPGVEGRAGFEDQYRSDFSASDAEGHFAFTNVPPGLTQLTLYPDEQPKTTDGPFEVRAGLEVVRVVQLARGAVLEGLSLDASGAAVGGAPLHLVALDDGGKPSGPVRERRADAAGAFRFAGLAAGTYQLTRLHGRADAPWIELQVTARVAADSTTSVRLQPHGRATLEGRLKVATGTLPARLFVSATSLDAGEPLVRGAVAEDGHFRFEALAAGRWEVRGFLYRDDTVLKDAATLELRDGETASVELELH